MLDQSRYERDLGECDRVLARHPNHIAAWIMKAKALGQLRHFEESLHAWERVLERKPRNKEALWWRAWALDKLQRYSEAASAYYALLDVLPPDKQVSAWYYMAVCLANLRRWHDAITCYDRALSTNERYPSALIGKGRALIRIQRG